METSPDNIKTEEAAIPPTDRQLVEGIDGWDKNQGARPRQSASKGKSLFSIYCSYIKQTYLLSMSIFSMLNLIFDVLYASKSLYYTKGAYLATLIFLGLRIWFCTCAIFVGHCAKSKKKGSGPGVESELAR